jgi:hypothetical protein
MRLKLRRSEILLILGFWVVGCALLGGVFYFALNQNQPTSISDTQTGFTPQATITVLHSQMTAKTLEEQAVDKALRWNSDAELVSVTSNWENATVDSIGSPSRWVYRFYSPSNQRLFLVTITPQGEVIGTSHAERIRNEPTPVPPSEWTTDSLNAINIWLNHNGHVMLENLSGVLVVAQLQQLSRNSPITWTVSGYHPPSKNYHTVFIDAKSGEILNIETSLR